MYEIPCPFCGDTYIIPHESKEYGYTIGCNTLNCICLHTEGKTFRTKAEAIRAWNRRTDQRWIPCDERLPDQYGNYLISYKTDDEIDIGTIDPKDKRWSACDANGFYWVDNKGLDVTAWMPMLEPYMEE